jgi:uncharacterized protein YbcV (DUF1398 family)
MKRLFTNKKNKKKSTANKDFISNNGKDKRIHVTENENEENKDEHIHNQIQKSHKFSQFIVTLAKISLLR